MRTIVLDELNRAEHDRVCNLSTIDKSYQDWKSKMEQKPMAVAFKGVMSVEYSCPCGKKGYVKNNLMKCSACDRDIRVVIYQKYIGKKIKTTYTNEVFKMSFKILRLHQYGKVSYDQFEIMTKKNGNSHIQGEAMEKRELSFGEELNKQQGLINSWNRRPDRILHPSFSRINHYSPLVHEGEVSWLYSKLRLRYATFEDLASEVEIFKAYFKKAFKLRGVSRKAEEFTTSLDAIRSGFILLKYPALQHLPFTNYKGIPEGSRKEMKRAKDVKGLWGALDLDVSKAVRKKIVGDEGKAALVQIYSKHIKKASNMLRLLNDSKGNAKSLFAYHGEELSDFDAGMNLLASTHEDETVWFNRLMKLRRSRSEFEVVSYIADIGNMLKQIRAKKSNFSPKETKNIVVLHNELVREGEKIKKGNKVITYRDHELELEDTVGDLEFVLPKETFDLVEVGGELRNCVGSYGNRAASKMCYIVFVRKNNKTVACLEIRGGVIVQAKAQLNRKPDKEVKKEIISWSKLKGLDINTWDLEEPLIDTQYNIGLYRDLARDYVRNY